MSRSETYAVAFHRYTDQDGYPTDMWAGLRYVDRFERRDGQWRIRRRVCAYEWRRKRGLMLDALRSYPDPQALDWPSGLKVTSIESLTRRMAWAT